MLNYGGEYGIKDSYLTVKIEDNNTNPEERNTIDYLPLKEGYGPYDIVFPLNSFPFIWDHGSWENIRNIQDQEILSEALNNPSPYKYNGHMAARNDNQTWILTDSTKDSDFTIRVFVISGKLVFPSGSIEGVEASGKSLSEATAAKYENFFVPPGNVCLMGRGISGIFNFNPLEFDIYSDKEDNNSNYKKRSPTAKLISKPIQVRTNFPNGEKGGFIDYDHWVRKDYEMDPKKNNFLCVPDDRSATSSNSSTSPSGIGYGFDVLLDLPNGIFGSSRKKVNSALSSTSMMIGVDGTKPSNMTYPSPDMNGTDIIGDNPPVMYTKLRDPLASERTKKSSLVSGFGFTQTVGVETRFESKYLEIGMNCKPPLMCPTVFKDGGQDTSERFASPIFFRAKGRHYIPPPDPGDYIHLDGLIKSVSFDCQSSDFIEVRQNMKIEVLIPKTYQWNDFDIPNAYDDNGNITSTALTRNELIDWLSDGIREVRVWIGWGDGSKLDPVLEETKSNDLPNPYKMSDIMGTGYNGRDKLIKIFTGISTSGPLKESYEEDTITLDCKDKIQMLQDQTVINSPIFDGMNVANAFRNICQLEGLPEEMFDIHARYINNEILPIGYSYQEPRVKFDGGTSLYDAIKKTCCTKYWHVLRTDPDGKIILTDLNLTSMRSVDSFSFKNPSTGEIITKNDSGVAVGRHAKLEDLPLTHPSYVFYLDGSKAPNAFQMALGTSTFNRNFLNKYSNIELYSMDRGGAKGPVSWVFDGSSFDVASIEDVSSHDFIGYKKSLRNADPAYGTREKVWAMRKNLENHVYEFPMNFTFNIYGRAMIRPYDIIEIVMPDTGDNAPFHSYIDRDGEMVVRIKLRVLNVSGSLKIEKGQMYQMSITAERR
jgi:hypothetical protein